jgi:hypothetical protein
VLGSTANDRTIVNEEVPDVEFHLTEDRAFTFWRRYLLAMTFVFALQGISWMAFGLRFLAHAGLGVTEVRVISPHHEVLGIGFFDDEDAFGAAGVTGGRTSELVHRPRADSGRRARDGVRVGRRRGGLDGPPGGARGEGSPAEGGRRIRSSRRSSRSGSLWTCRRRPG